MDSTIEKEAASGQVFVDYAELAQQHKDIACTNNIVPRKTVVYETLVDPTVIKISGEKIKKRLFTKLRFIKPKSAPIELFSMRKYYEPHIVVHARYFLDYYRMNDYTIPIDKEVTEVIVLKQKFYPKQAAMGGSIKIDSEERLLVEKKAFLMLDKNGREIDLETLPSAPSEKNTEETIKKYEIEELSPEADVDYVRKRLVKRPENISRIVTEIFEVSERVVIYAPRFELTYIDTSNYKKRTVEFDGVTSKRVKEEKLHSIVAQALRGFFTAVKSKFS